MRRIIMVAVPVLALGALGLSTMPGESVPRYVNIVSACDASGSPSVQPQQIRMERVDNIEWREQSGRATSWTITPKDTLQWPFTSRSFTGTQTSPANSGPPLPTAQEERVYSYDVTINCADGTTQLIDPDIIIGPVGD